MSVLRNVLKEIDQLNALYKFTLYNCVAKLHCIITLHSDATTQLFYKSRILKFIDLIYLRTVLFMLCFKCDYVFGSDAGNGH